MKKYAKYILLFLLLLWVFFAWRYWVMKYRESKWICSSKVIQVEWIVEITSDYELVDWVKTNLKYDWKYYIVDYTWPNLPRKMWANLFLTFTEVGKYMGTWEIYQEYWISCTWHLCTEHVESSCKNLIRFPRPLELLE